MNIEEMTEFRALFAEIVKMRDRMEEIEQELAPIHDNVRLALDSLDEDELCQGRGSVLENELDTLTDLEVAIEAFITTLGDIQLPPTPFAD